MAFQMVRNFFGQRSPSRSGAHEPVIESESFGNQGGTARYDTRDVGKTANSNCLELARHDKETSEKGRKPHIKPRKPAIKFVIQRPKSTVCCRVDHFVTMI